MNKNFTTRSNSMVDNIPTIYYDNRTLLQVRKWKKINSVLNVYCTRYTYLYIFCFLILNSMTFIITGTLLLKRFPSWLYLWTLFHSSSNSLILSIVWLVISNYKKGTDIEIILTDGHTNIRTLNTKLKIRITALISCINSHPIIIIIHKDYWFKL